MRARCKIKIKEVINVRILETDAKTALKNTSMPARHNQTEDKPSGHRLPSKRNSVSLKLSRNRRDKRIVPVDIHVIGNLVFICSRHDYFRIEKKNR